MKISKLSFRVRLLVLVKKLQKSLTAGQSVKLLKIETKLQSILAPAQPLAPAQQSIRNLEIFAYPQTQ